MVCIRIVSCTCCYYIADSDNEHVVPCSAMHDRNKQEWHIRQGDGLKNLQNCTKRTDMGRQIYQALEKSVGIHLVLPIVRYVAETWTMREAERKKVDSVEMWCWRRVMIV